MSNRIDWDILSLALLVAVVMAALTVVPAVAFFVYKAAIYLF